MDEGARFLFERITDAPSGVEVIVLGTPPGSPGARLEARVAPGVGGNLFWLRVDDDELLAQPPSLRDLAIGGWGTPVMFPWPNRVRDAAFVFEGRRFDLVANHGAHAIHGLVRGLAFQVAAPVVDQDHVAVALSIEWNANQPDFAQFPIEHRLTVTHALDRDGVTISYAVENRGAQRLPFGFGLHPWFRVAKARDEIVLRVPAVQRMEVDEKLPTGVLLSVAGTPFDLRDDVSLAALDLDDVYIGVTPADPASFASVERDLCVTLGGTADFGHVVVYTPSHRAVFCIENQTASTDAHNLYDRGLTRESGLRIVAPGETVTGAVTWTISRPLPP